IDHEGVAFARRFPDVDDEPEKIHFPNGVDGRVDHPDVHPVQRPVNSWRVEEDHLRVIVVAHAENPRPRRLGLVGNDGELGTDEAVQERRFSGIGPADEGDKAEFQTNRDLTSASSVSSVVASLEIRTRLMRRRSASSTSTVNPSMSKRSPTAGT